MVRASPEKRVAIGGSEPGVRGEDDPDDVVDVGVCILRGVAIDWIGECS